jgi:tRNA(Ile)-lysidine synthase
MDLIATLDQQLKCVALQAEQTLVLAYSGGIDSHVLLHALVALRDNGLLTNPISALHIHHGLSPNADEWLAHCRQICLDMKVAFQGVKVNLGSDSGQSLEALAREARYAKLLELAPANSVILLAQHQDDQLETFLLQLKRGAGPKGLAAMALYSTKLVGQLNKVVHLLRPFLALTQQNINDYAKQQHLVWVEDESNQNTHFERNFLRHDILPSLIKKWPDIAKTVSRSAALCAQQQDLLEEVAQEKLQAIRTSDNTLGLQALSKLSSAWLHQVVRQWLDEQGIASPSQAILQKLQPELIDAKEDAKPIIQWGNWQFRRFNQHLYVLALAPTIPAHTLLWQGQKIVNLPAPLGSLSKTNFHPGKLNDGDLVVEPQLGDIKIHFGGFAQRFTPTGCQHSKPLKQWYKEWKIPPWQRDKIALVSQNDKPLALLINGVWRLANSAVQQDDRASLMVLRYRASSGESLASS